MHGAAPAAGRIRWGDNKYKMCEKTSGIPRNYVTLTVLIFMR